jgi:hypothetical protein
MTSTRVLIGVALSMVAHVALLFAWRPAPQPYIAPPPAPLVLHLQTPAPPAPAPVVAAAPPPPATRPAASPKAPRRVIAVAPKPSAAAEPAVVVEAQPVETPAPSPLPKKFDLDAARSTARIVGTHDAPNADDAPLARLKKQQEENAIRTESKAAQAISAAKRGDCKDGLPGGLLAPLIMMTQKAGTGCKW